MCFMSKFILFLVLVLFITPSYKLTAIDTLQVELEKVTVPNKRKPQEFPYNPLVSIELWETLKPYFLPKNHSAKSRLDRIFSKKRAIQSTETFTEAGFGEPTNRGPEKIRFGKHRDIQGIIIKVFCDDQPIIDEWQYWIRRIQGAELIRSYIEEKKFTRFKVPKKWIYPLPENPAPVGIPECFRKNFILVAEDMHLKSYDESKRAYKKMSKKTMEQLFMIIRDLGLIDSVFVDNVPMTSDGRFAFIDIEHFNRTEPINYARLTEYFSDKLKPYWESMIKYGGPEFVPETKRL